MNGPSETLSRTGACVVWQRVKYSVAPLICHFDLATVSITWNVNPFVTGKNLCVSKLTAPCSLT